MDAKDVEVVVFVVVAVGVMVVMGKMGTVVLMTVDAQGVRLVMRAMSIPSPIIATTIITHHVRDVGVVKGAEYAMIVSFLN